MEARIEPIKKKFAYLEEHEQEFNITEDDQLRIRNLPEAWKKFNDGLMEASQVMIRSSRLLKGEVDNQIDDFKRAVQDNKKNF